MLFRVNAQSEAYEQALADVGVPYVVRGGQRFFDRAEVREGIRFLRGAARSADAAGPQPLPGAVRHVLAAAGWTDEPPNTTGATRERWDGLAALVRLAGAFSFVRVETRRRTLFTRASNSRRWNGFGR